MLDNQIKFFKIASKIESKNYNYQIYWTNFWSCY